VRILAATNRTLVEEVAAGRFREDLFYRLAVAVIQLPPLRERPGDAGLLLDRLLDQVNRESATEPGYSPKILSVNARKLLLEHPWPGNVREMLNTLRLAAVWTPGPTIDLEDARDALLPRPMRDLASDPHLAQDVSQGIDLNATIDRIARHYLEQAMRLTGGNKTRAARLLGFGNPTTLSNWLKKHGVEA
jgi:DNA-binding NtrC family response regulator